LDDGSTAERLVLAIVQNAHANAVQSSLLEHKFRVTRINTAGGFLRRGNVTFLVGVTTDQVGEVVEIIRANAPRQEPAEGTGEPTQSAMLFVLPVARFARI